MDKKIKKSICKSLKEFYFEQFNFNYINMYDIIDKINNWDWSSKENGPDMLLSFFKDEITCVFSKEEISEMKAKGDSDSLEKLDDECFNVMLDFLFKEETKN